MKQLTDDDIENMATGEFIPDARQINRDVRANLHLSRLIPRVQSAPPRHARLDLHHYTQEQAWELIMELAKSGARSADIITGASGVLHQKFPQWATESILAPYILSFRPINNGAFYVQFRRNKIKNAP